ncbi:ADP-ribosylation [Annulohypoxylon moriforme]|nr:ADP-ribosylation [Annulohypoxylon moriforme]
MFGFSQLLTFVSFLALLCPALAARLYRMDFRPPAELHRDGGLLSKNPHGEGSVIDHVYARLGNNDPWVSTTNDRKLARQGATSPGNAYVYYINPSGLKPVDVEKEFQKAHEDNPHPGEGEFSIQGYIPWDHIDKWETYTRGKKTATTTREQFEQGHGSSSKARSFVA